MANAAQQKGKLKYLNISDIIVGDRYREDFGDLEELVASIKDKGVFQPISVSTDGKLLAGGRRVAASIIAGLTQIPALIRESSDEIDKLEIELFENIHRKDFSWQEKAKLTKAIDSLYKAKDPSWSGRKTAALLDRSVGDISMDVTLASYIEAIPELGELKTANDARKMIKKMEETALVNELAGRQQIKMAAPAPQGSKVDPEANLKALLRRADGCYQISDVFAGMAKMRSNGHVNFIECDPPYGIELNEQKASRDNPGSTVQSYEEVPKDEYPEFLGKLTKELFRVAAKDAWLVFWYGPSWHTQVLAALREAGWLVDEIPAIWNKFTGQTLQPELYLARTYEPFFICRKGSPVIVNRGRANVFSIEPVPGQKKYHPTQRPSALIRDLLRTFCLPNHYVFVPFLGSGATLRVVFTEGMSGHGFDLNGEYKPRYLLGVEEDARAQIASSAITGKIQGAVGKSATGTEEEQDDIPF